MTAVQTSPEQHGDASDAAGQEQFPAGAQVLVRDEVWLVRNAVPTADDGTRVEVVGVSDFVRDQEAVFFTGLDTVELIDPRDTRLIADGSPTYRRSRLFLEAVLRRTALPQSERRLALADSFLLDPLPYQRRPAELALSGANLSPRLLIADVVGLGKTLEIGLTLAELIRRGYAAPPAVCTTPLWPSPGGPRRGPWKSGALDVFAELIVPDHDALLTLVDAGLGRLDGVVDIHSSVVLRLLLTTSDWAPYDDEPTDVRRHAIEGRPLPEPPVVDELDRRLVALLHRDARMSTTRLARELRVGETTARRRLGRLMDSHVLHLRLHAEPEVLGYPVEARFRLAVGHARLDAAIRRLAEEPAVRQLVVTTGTTALLGYSSHRSARDLHDFTARVLGSLDGVTSAEVAVLMRTYKRAGFESGP